MPTAFGISGISGLGTVIAAAADEPSLANPWVVGGGAVSLLSLLSFLVWRVLKLSSSQYMVASKQAQELVRPLQTENERLAGRVEELEQAVKACEADSRAERTWNRILVGRLIEIVRGGGLPIPEETWIRP